ncbi:transglycosylase domain-containing protein [Streptacidiphilus jeojiense]|uniref:transglycosylase domain-containing protein n=1 Tax=Streptacidiphilus jeojiense TaxID=436229 RepID=UPI0012F710FD|nr:transglycosylase domain-containing protein [Streptacidiphilus jeojiense]
MAKRSRSPLYKVGLGLNLVGASVLAGTLVAGLALPAVGALGFGAKSATTSFNEIPAEFTAPTLSQASTIYDANGGVIAKVYARDRTVVPISKIAPVMRQALVDIEDNRYYQHGAIDLQGTLRALTKNASSGASQGGSTLTQQLVKNMNVELAGNDPTKVREAQAQTIGRKISELKVAIKLEETLTKDQILTDYLNITFWGEQAYGIEAASERYFSVHASQLTVPQAAMLAGMVQSPSNYDPLLYAPAATTRRNEVLDAMAKYGSITAAQAAVYKAKPLGLKVSRPKEGCITARNGEQFFCDYVEHIFLSNPVFGQTAQARQALWDRGGLDIHTTIDPKVQTALQKSVTSHVHADEKAATAMTIIQPGTGKIMGMGQSRPYGNGSSAGVTTLNYNVDRTMGGGGGFPTGSTVKPITAAAALENGIGMDQTYDAPFTEPYPAMTDCKGNHLREVTNPPDMNDSTTLVGPFNMPTAMAKSVNTYFVPLEKDAGLCNVVADAITTMLKGVVEDGTGAADGFTDGRPSAGKTGTTNEHLQVWFVGFTPQLSGATVVSDTGAKLTPLYDGQTIGGTSYGKDEVFGSTIAGPIWHDAMDDALRGVGFRYFHTVSLPAPVKTKAQQAKDKNKNKTGGTTAGTTTGTTAGTTGTTTAGTTGTTGTTGTNLIGGLTGGTGVTGR